MPVSYKRTAKGPVIVALQEKLGVDRVDGIFGRLTQAAVRNVQRQAGWMESGDADKAVFEILGAQFPDEFLRCLNLTSALEGTGFGDINSTDIDNYGITMGVIGFTSRTGEVQEVLRRYLEARPSGMDGLISKARLYNLKQLINGNAPHKAWLEYAYDKSGRIYLDFDALIMELGKDQDWRNIQVRMARKQCWEPAMKVAEKLGIKSTCGRCLMFDIFVQNGGWRVDHQKFVDQETLDGTEPTLLRAIARAAAARATKQWRKDVLARKLLFVEQVGFVHGEFFDVDCYAIDCYSLNT